MSEANRQPRLPVFVVGTRAQLIKVAPVIVACERIGLPLRLLMTGQHQETMQDLIEEFGIRAQPLAAIPAGERATVGSLLRWLPVAYAGIRAELVEMRCENKALDVIVHGDTASTVLGAWAGYRGGDRVVHLESGLTSGRLFDPFPEELSRRIVFRLCDVAFCPNPASAALMRRFRRCTVVETAGNTILDAVRLAGADPGLRDAATPYVVASLHRFQNLYDRERLHALVRMIEAIGERMPVHFVLHPATRGRLAKEGLDARLATAPGVRLSPRLGYGDFMRLAAGAACVLTDGGSNQEELAALGVPTLVMRERTERPDGLGSNAKIEGDVPGGVLQFLLDGRYETLRRPPVVGEDMGPSRQIAEFLAGAAHSRAPPDVERYTAD
jgi:UDP-N-acetylglucosamine 2-epimerase (non-hydrolysing)